MIQNLIASLEIFQRVRPDARTFIDRDILYIFGPKHSDISTSDIDMLESLGFYWDGEHWFSMRYGNG